MRALVFVLVFANLLLFAWAQGYFGTPESPDARRLQQQLNAEKLSIVPRDASAPASAEATSPSPSASAEKAEATAAGDTGKADARPSAVEKASDKAADKRPEVIAPGAVVTAPPKSEAAKPVADKTPTKAPEKATPESDKDASRTVSKAPVAAAANVAAAPPAADAAKAAGRCLRWGELAASDAERLERLAGERFPGAQIKRTAGASVPAGWWVYIPPLASRAEAERKANELKRLEAPELFVILDPGPNRYAISLGLFSSEEAANDRLNALRAKGVRTARVGERGALVRPATLQVQVADAQAGALRQAAAQWLPAAHPGPCQVAR
ncbi:hypothetical protein GH865_03755 [Rhodocyclus tenuis]|uniref:SPOR domain-containing protein n=1 Tax=Rhodocyclus gracilis TaxID=2929842 RepID=UPI0012989C9C|nr:SPOR domain-containing protein [Rhodocyclus gracilis]MRD72367.1 hypothetical protein [Rhodocyclus gracilis]